MSSAWKDVFAGSIGGVTMTLFGHPCDLVKTKLQSTSHAYRGAVHCVTSTVKREGFRGLFKGMSPPLSMISVMNASLFGISSFMKEIVARVRKKPVSDLAMSDILLSSEMSVPFYVGVVTPVERLKVCLMTQEAGKPTNAGPIESIRQLGLRGLWRGYGVIVLMRALGLPAYLGSYEFTKRKLCDTGRSDESSIWKYMLSGAIAGFAFWTVTYPVDFVKTRVQQSGEESARRGAFEIAKQVFTEGGVRGFYRGIGPCLVRAGPSNAICFATVELVKDYVS